jgi:hypothetical protein
LVPDNRWEAQIVLTDAALQVVVDLASADKSESTIAHAVGVSTVTWTALKRRDPRVVDALEYGRGLARDAYIEQLQKHGKQNFVPLVFLLKGLHGVTEGAPPETLRPSITINLAGAAPLATYTPPKLIEQEQTDDTSGDR